MYYLRFFRSDKDVERALELIKRTEGFTEGEPEYKDIAAPQRVLDELGYPTYMPR